MEIRWECKVQNNAYTLHGDTKGKKESPWRNATGSLDIKPLAVTCHSA
jgi:hypothetical protein